MIHCRKICRLALENILHIVLGKAEKMQTFVSRKELRREKKRVRELYWWKKEIEKTSLKFSFSNFDWGRIVRICDIWIFCNIPNRKKCSNVKGSTIVFSSNFQSVIIDIFFNLKKFFYSYITFLAQNSSYKSRHRTSPVRWELVRISSFSFTMKRKRKELFNWLLWGTI